MYHKIFYVYVLANKKYGTLYVGVTNDLIRRIEQHKNGQIKSFTRKYSLTNLVYFEETNDINTALNREKQLKWWKRDWKINLIEKSNPEWIDLYSSLKK